MTESKEFPHGFPLVAMILDVMANREIYEGKVKSGDVMRQLKMNKSKVKMAGVASIELWKDKYQRRAKDIVLFAKEPEERSMMDLIVNSIVYTGNFKLIKKSYVAGGIQWRVVRVK